MTKTIKPILVLLPGFDGTGRLFSPLRRQLLKDIDTIVLSYPNHRPMSYSELYHALKDELPNTPYVLLGESFGGPLAMLLSKLAGANLKGIILCASFIRNPHPLLTKLLRPILKPSHFRKETPNWYIKAFLLGSFSDETLAHNMKAATRELTPEIYYCRLKEIADIDVTKILENCEVPILYIRASQDRLVYKSSMRLIKSLGKNVTVQSIDAPHMLLQTQPGKSARYIQEFINRVMELPS